MEKLLSTRALARVINATRIDYGIDEVLTEEQLNNEVAELRRKLNDSAQYEEGTIVTHYHTDEETGLEEVIWLKVSMSIALELIVNESLPVRNELRKGLLAVIAGNIRKENEVSISDYAIINKHGMTSNRLFRGRFPHEEKFGTWEDRPNYDDGLIKTDLYKQWLKDFPRDEVPTQAYWESQGVDFTKPIHLRLGFVHLKYFDVANLEKAVIDTILNKRNGVIKVDDQIVHKVTKQSFGICKDMKDGKIYIHISNL